MGFKTNISKLHYDKGVKGGVFNLLKGCSYFYAAGSGLKNKLYDKGFLKPKKVDAYVVSVGNLTTGGVGKTPVVAQIAQYYIERNEKVAIVSRGYGAKLSNKNINVISNGNEIFFKINKQKFPPQTPYIIWTLFSLTTLFVFYNRLKITKESFVTHIGKNAIFFYFGQGISSSLIYFLVVPMKELMPWWILMVIIYVINVILAFIIASVLKKFDAFGWNILEFLRKKTAQ